MKKIKRFAIVMIATLCVGRAANAQNMNNIYQMAAVNDALGIAKEQNLEITDENGDTAICHAIKNFDATAYSVLKDAGANTGAECVKKLPEKMRDSFMKKLAAGQDSKKFLGLGKWAWGAIGIGAAGGIVAMSGGSSGGGDTGPTGREAEGCSFFNYEPSEPCPEGWEHGNTCTDIHGKVWAACNQPAKCPYTTTSCKTGYMPTGNTCKSGNTTYIECTKASCDDDYVSFCPIGYTVVDKCYEGGDVKVKCEKTPCGANAYWTTSGCRCNDGYRDWQYGQGCSLAPIRCGAHAYQDGTICKCDDGYENWKSTRGCSLSSIDCGAHAYQQDTTCQCDNGYENWQSGQGCSLVPIDCGVHAIQNGTSCQCDSGYENWQSGQGCSLTIIDCGANATQMGTSCQCMAGYSDWQPGIGCGKSGSDNVQNNKEISVSNTTGGAVYGMNITHAYECSADEVVWGYCDHDLFPKLYIRNPANLDSKFSDSGTIRLTTSGNGLVYGMYSDFSITNVYVRQDGRTSVKGLIDINNNGDSTVYGMYSGSSGYATNIESHATDKYSSNGQAEINIKNIGNGDTYGIWASNEARNALFGGIGKIHIEHTGAGNVYGMYGISLVNARHIGIGYIDITNIGDGDVFGLYGYGTTGKAEVSNTAGSKQGFITVDNSGSGNAYGIYTNGDIAINSRGISELVSASIINIINRLGGNAYGIYGLGRNTYNSYIGDGRIGVTNESTGMAAGMSGYGTVLVNAYSENGTASSYGSIGMTNVGQGIVYGMKASTVENATGANSSGNIYIENKAGGLAYGMYGSSVNNGLYGGDGYILMRNFGNGEVCGMYGKQVHNAVNYKMSNGIIIASTGKIVGYNFSSGNAYGIVLNAGNMDGIATNNDNSTITMQNVGTGNVFGIYASDTEQSAQVENAGDIIINNIGTGMAVGIYAGRNSNVSNTGTITIKQENFKDVDGILHTPTTESGATVFGIYAKSGSSVNNSGTINITSNGDAYGIYAESGSTVTNTGTISLNGVSCSGADCDTGNYIVLNGSTLYNSGIMSALQMNLNSMGGDVVAGIGSRFVIDNDFSGNLNISSEWVQDGNQTTYIAENMIEAGDISGLNVRSASAMFDASIADNGHDVIMQMKDFDSLTDNKSLAAFLANNYAKGNGNDLFNALKSIGDMTTFNGALSGLTGVDAFTQFAHEDLSAMREISFSMNNKLFENSGRDNFDVSDNMAYFSFSNSRNGGSGQYGISSAKIGENLKLGYGMAMANINTGDDSGMHRQNKLWLFYMPATYTADGYELVVAPKAGFAHSEYNRRGYNNINYDGQIEKRIFGLMNDLRYPLSVGNWTVAPDLAFNTIVYTQSGHEDAQAFGLIIPDDRTVSVETGLGFYTKYEKNLTDGGRLKLNSGLMAYREFGNAYDIKLGIRGLDGTFSLYNNDYEYRGAASMGFDYVSGRLHLYGDAQYFMDNNRYMNFKGGFAFRF